MRTIVRFFFFAIISVALFSCKKEPILDLLGNDSFTFEATGGAVTVSFSTNNPWTAKLSDSWVQATPLFGEAGTSSINIVADANQNYNQRSAALTISCGGITKVVSFTQKEVFGFELSATELSIGSNGGELKIPIKSNTDYSISVDSDAKSWLSVTQTKALFDYTIIVNVAKNESYNQRIGKISLTYNDKMTTLTIIQSQYDELIVDTKEYNIDHNGGEIRVPIRTNIEYDAKILEGAADWISILTLKTKGLEDYHLVLNVSENNNSGGRIGQVKISGAGKESILTINQGTKGSIYCSESILEIESIEEHYKTVYLHSDVDFQYEILDDASSWIYIGYVSPSGKQNEYVIGMRFYINTSYENRTGRIRFSGNGEECILTIKQKQWSIIMPDYTSLEVDNNGTTVTLPVFSNVGWDISIPSDMASWIGASIIEKTDQNNSLINISVKSNNTGAGRKGAIELIGPNTNTTISVTQGATPIAVDLGLSVKWSNINLGAIVETDYGGFYAWGETFTKVQYRSENYPWFHGTDSGWTIDTYYDNPGGFTNISGTGYDAASVKWGGKWRLPTEGEARELERLCKWEATAKEGINGYVVTGPNGNCIFIPAAGRHGMWVTKNNNVTWCLASTYCEEGTEMYLWTSTAYKTFNNAMAARIKRPNDGATGDYYYATCRYEGLPIRPVTE